MERLLISVVCLCNLLFCDVFADVHPALLQKFDTEGCQQELQKGIQTLFEMSDRLAKHEEERRTHILTSLKENAGQTTIDSADSIFDENTTGLCPTPMPPIFPPPEMGVSFTSIFPYKTEQDLYIKYMTALAKILKDEESTCGGPKIESLSSVTMEQFYGFISIFATNYAQPLCPVCKEVVGAFREEVMKLDDSSSEDKRFIIQMFMAHFPSTETLCSMLLPSCHEHLLKSIDEEDIEPTIFADRSTTVKAVTQPLKPKPSPIPISYNSTHCFTCQFCMTGTMLIEHKFLLEPNVVKIVWDILHGTIVYNLCAELCIAYPPGQSSSNPFFPNGVDFNRCMDMAEFEYFKWTQKLIAILIPDKFCSNALYPFCKKHETPNILHCLKSYCMDLQGRFSFLKIICSLIPDHPEEADKYLNIRQSRKRKDDNFREEL